MNKQCNIFGVQNQSEPDPLIKKALNSSIKLLDIFKFIEITNFEINPIMTNWFWQIMVNNHCAHVGTVVLEWFGYEGDLRTQKRKFIDIKRNSIPYKELTSKEEIELYPTIKEEILSLPHKGAIACSNGSNEPYDIKIAMLRLNTKFTNIKQYYIKMEELIRLYAHYTTLFIEKEKEQMSRK